MPKLLHSLRLQECPGANNIPVQLLRESCTPDSRCRMHAEGNSLALIPIPRQEGSMEERVGSEAAAGGR